MHISIIWSTLIQNADNCLLLRYKTYFLIYFIIVITPNLGSSAFFLFTISRLLQSFLHICETSMHFLYGISLSLSNYVIKRLYGIPSSWSSFNEVTCHHFKILILVHSISSCNIDRYATFLVVYL